MRTARTSGIARVIAVFGVLVAGLAVAPPAAHGSVSPNPTMSFPDDRNDPACPECGDAELSAGSTTTVVFDFTNSPHGIYHMWVKCPDMEWPGSVDTTTTYDGTNAVQSFQVTLPDAPQENCDATVDWDANNPDPWPWNDGMSGWTDYFQVVGPLGFSSVAVTNPTFYPVVHDGYKDTTALHVIQSRFMASASLDVYNAATGSRVRHEAWSNVHNFGVYTGGWSFSAKWNGHRNDGALAAPGKYRLVLKGTDQDGHTATATGATTLATGYFWLHGHHGLSGNEGRFSTRGNCAITRDNYDATATLDCWGGRYAKNAFVIGIPAGSTVTSWRIYTGQSSDDICCRGRITKSFTRLSATKFLLVHKVTGWRASVTRGATVYFKRRVHR
ncbi:hypothetical protein GCM10028801_35980 [Nocardioides maradonensis]